MIRRRLHFAALSIVLLVALSACGQQEPERPPPTSKQSDARFTSDTAALAEAQKVYKAYLSTSDDISADGGRGVDRLSPLVTAEELAQERSGSSYLPEHGLRVTGSTKLLKFKLQSADLVEGSVAAYACLDLSETRVLNEREKDVTPKARVDRQTSVAHFVWDENQLHLKDNGIWSGDSIC